jgi:hypothetical protein
MPGSYLDKIPFIDFFVPLIQLAAALAAIPWRGVRVVEGARLESVYTGNRIAGSNPALSAFPHAFDSSVQYNF